MQITSTNFRHYGVTASDLFNPCINLSVFEKIITDCYKSRGTLKKALSCYYSVNFDTGQKKEAELFQTRYLQRIGYTPTTARGLAGFGCALHFVGTSPETVYCRLLPRAGCTRKS